MTREYSSIRSDSSTAFGSLSIGACVCDGAIIGRRGGLSEKLGSLVPMLEHCWHTIRVAPSTSDLPGLPTISCPQISQNNRKESQSARPLPDRPLQQHHSVPATGSRRASIYPKHCGCGWIQLRPCCHDCDREPELC